MNKELILVVGANGMVGTELVRLLKDQGKNVRTTTSKAATGANEVHLNLVTGEGLKDAFEGVTKAFFLSPPGYADQHALLSPLVQEAKRRGLEKVVLMTAMGANAVETSPFRRVEIELERSGLTYNIIRPNWFMQNFHTFWIQGIKAQGKIFLPAGQAKTSFIDARDISAVAAKLLTSNVLENQDLDLTGPEALTHGEVAHELALATGKRIAYQEIPPEEFRQGLYGAGLPKDYADFLVLIMGFLREGYSERTTENVRKILGREPSPFRQYAKDFKNQW
jgi:uncharacterized protein YbjT (DUF2867 family)